MKKVLLAGVALVLVAVLAAAGYGVHLVGTLNTPAFQKTLLDQATAAAGADGPRERDGHLALLRRHPEGHRRREPRPVPRGLPHRGRVRPALPAPPPARGPRGGGAAGSRASPARARHGRAGRLQLREARRLRACRREGPPGGRRGRAPADRPEAARGGGRLGGHDRPHEGTAPDDGGRRLPQRLRGRGGNRAGARKGHDRDRQPRRTCCSCGGSRLPCRCRRRP